MPKLSTAIVQQNVASLRDVEEALARQVLYGGDLVTNLLQQADGVNETALVRLLAESLDLPPAPSGPLPKASAEALQLLPGDVALRHGLYPVALEGGTLVVFVSEHLADEVKQDLSFALGVDLKERAAPLVRIREAIGRDYGLPLDRRTLRVLAKLRGEPDPSPSIAPAPLRDAPALSSLPRPPSIPPLGPLAAAGMPEAYPAGTRAAQQNAFTAEATPSVHDAVTAPAPEVAAQASTAADLTPAPPEHKPTLRGMPASEAPPRPGSGQYALGGSELSAWSVQQKQGRRQPARQRRRGPYTAAQAEHDLLEAEGRDDVLGAFFDFSSQYFEYAALFAVVGDIAEGRDAHGPGADRSQITGIGVPLDLPSSLSHVRETRRWSTEALSPTGMDAQLARDLSRPIGKRVLLLPVTVRNRCVLIFYGDDGEADVQLSDVGDVIAFAPLVASSLENLIVRRKLAARQSIAAAAIPKARAPRDVERRSQVPPADERAEALFRALESPEPPDDPRRAAPEEVPAPPPSNPRSLTPAEVPRARASIPAGATAKPVVSVGSRAKTPPHGTLGPAGTRPREHVPRAPEARPAPVGDHSGPVFALTRRSSPTPLREEEPPEDGWELPDSSRHDPDSRSPDGPTALARAPGGRARSGDSPEASPEISVGTAVLEEDLDGDSLPESRSFAVAPQVPNKRYSSDELRLPSVIVNVKSDCNQLIDKLLGGDEGAIAALASLGNTAVSELVSRFPGPTAAPSGSPTRWRASGAGPILKALARIGPRAAPFVTVRTNDTSPEVRQYATRLLGEMPGPESAQAIVRRLTDSDERVRRAAQDAGWMLQSHEESRAKLRDAACSVAEDPSARLEARSAALEALADWRDPRAVPRLIPLVGEQSEAGKTAQWALSTITRQDFDADAGAWKDWYEKRAAGRHRIEWLIDSLMHDRDDIRRAAGEELKSLTKEYFGYYDDLPPAERARAQTRYREWWEASGKARFSGT